MQISANVILDLRNDVIAYAKSLQTITVEDKPLENTAIADALEAISDDVELAPSKNILTIEKEYIEKFADDLKIKGADRYMAMRIAKEMVSNVLQDVMLEIES